MMTMMTMTMTMSFFSLFLTVGADTSREERAFRLCMNSLGLPVRYLVEDLKDGVILLKVGLCVWCVGVDGGVRGWVCGCG